MICSCLQTMRAGRRRKNQPQRKSKIPEKKVRWQRAKNSHLRLCFWHFFVLADIYVVYRRTSRQCISLFWRDIANETGDGFTHVRAWQIVLDTVQYIAITIAPFVIFAFVIAFLSQRIQITWKVTSKPMEPKLNKLSPISGFKRMFSKQSLFELVLSIFKIVVFRQWHIRLSRIMSEFL